MKNPPDIISGNILKKTVTFSKDQWVNHWEIRCSLGARIVGNADACRVCQLLHSRVMSPLWPLLELISWCPFIYSNHCNCFRILSQLPDNSLALAWEWGWGRVGVHLNIKIPSYLCRDSHYKDITVSQLSYLYNGNSHTRKDCLYIEMGPLDLEQTKPWTRLRMAPNHYLIIGPSIIFPAIATWLTNAKRFCVCIVFSRSETYITCVVLQPFNKLLSHRFRCKYARTGSESGCCRQG